MGKNKVRFGFKNVHLAFEDTTAEVQPAWKTPIPIPGAVSFSAKPEGDSNEFYADDGVYFRISANNGYSGDLGLALLPDEVKAEMFGWKFDDNGTLVEDANGICKKFALMGEVSGDARNRRFVFYNVQAERPDDSLKTKEKGIDPQSETIPIKIAPMEIAGLNIVKGTMELSDTNKEKFKSFFSAVYKPVFTPEA